MPVDPFPISKAKRVFRSPNLQAAYFAWEEIIPILGEKDRIHISNLLTWSVEVSRNSIGSSRELFRNALGINEDTTDKWMSWLGDVGIGCFIVHGIPFLRNSIDLRMTNSPDHLVELFLKLTNSSRLSAELGNENGFQRTVSPPQDVIIEITNSCNFSCVMCSMRGGGFNENRTMPIQMFQEVLKILGKSLRRLRINGYGETSIVPNLSEYLDIVDRMSPFVQKEIITNLSSDISLYLDLWKRGYILLVSWDGATSQTMEKIRRGSHFNKMVEKLLVLGNQAISQPERLGVIFTVQEKNLHELIETVNLASKLGVGLVILNMVNEDSGSPWMISRYEEITELFKEALAVAVRNGITIRIPNQINGIPVKLSEVNKTSGTHCNLPWHEILVHWDGELTPCNMFNPTSYGRLFNKALPALSEDRFSEIWNGPNARLFRDLINTERTHPYCKYCYYLHSK